MTHVYLISILSTIALIIMACAGVFGVLVSKIVVFSLMVVIVLLIYFFFHGVIFGDKWSD